MYTIEQIIQIWSKVKPLYFKIVSGASKGGITKFDGSKEPGEDKGAVSDALLDEFQECVNMLNDGTYTVIMRSSESAARNEKIYTFKVGEGIGNATDTKEKAQNVGGGNLNMMMFQMMMQQQQQNQALIMQMLEKQHDTKAQMWQKDMEMFKLQQSKSMGDKVFGLLEKPHIAGMFTQLLKPQIQAVGRAEAPPPPNNVVPTTDQMERAKRLQELLRIVEAEYPEADPIDTLENGFFAVRNYMQNTEGGV